MLKIFEFEALQTFVYGKQCRQNFKIGSHKSKGILDYIHSNVSGSSPIVSFGGSSYFVTFIYDYSRKVWVYFRKRKVDVFNVFKQLRDLVQKSISMSIKCLRIDNGGEFTSKEFKNYYKEVGIKRHKTIV